MTLNTPLLDTVDAETGAREGAHPHQTKVVGVRSITAERSVAQRRSYTLAVRLALVMILMHFVFKIFVLLAVQRLNDEDQSYETYHGLYQQAKAVQIFLSLAFFLALSAWALVGVGFFYEYRRADSMIAWKELFGLWDKKMGVTNDGDKQGERVTDDHVACMFTDRNSDYRLKSTLLKALGLTVSDSYRVLSTAALVIEPVTAVCLLLWPAPSPFSLSVSVSPSHPINSFVQLVTLCWAIHMLVTCIVLIMRLPLIFCKQAKELSHCGSQSLVLSLFLSLCRCFGCDDFKLATELDLNVEKLWLPFSHSVVGSLCVVLSVCCSANLSRVVGKVLLAFSLLRLLLVMHWVYNQFFAVLDMAVYLEDDFLNRVISMAMLEEWKGSERWTQNWQGTALDVDWMRERQTESEKQSMLMMKEDTLWTLQRKSLRVVALCALRYSQMPIQSSYREIIPREVPEYLYWSREMLQRELRMCEMEMKDRAASGLYDSREHLHDVHRIVPSSKYGSKLNPSMFRIALQRFRTLNYKARRMLLVLAFANEKTEIVEIIENEVHANHSWSFMKIWKKRGWKKENLIKRLKDHNPYFVRIIGEYI
jgi:hypothetical protein